MLVLSLIGGLGMGDVKLAALLGLAGAFISVEAVLAQVILSFVAGGLVAAVFWLFKRRGRIPFGPFMLLGYWSSTTIALTQLAG